jgi:hypothetical protein
VGAIGKCGIKMKEKNISVGIWAFPNPGTDWSRKEEGFKGFSGLFLTGF